MQQGDIKYGWRHLRSEQGPSIQLFTVRFDYLRNPRNEKEVRVIVLDSPETINVIALTPDNKVVLVRQFRFGLQELTLECPGGIVDPGEEIREAAKRELQEETGYTGEDWTFLGKIPSNPVFQNNYVHHWLVRNAQPTAIQELDEAEDVEIVEVALAEIPGMIQQGEINHPHAIAALMRLPEVWKLA